MKKSSSDFLAGADFSEGAVLLRVEIDLERLLVGADIHLRVHTPSRCGHLHASQPTSGLQPPALHTGRRDCMATSGLAARPWPESTRGDRSATPRRANRRVDSELDLAARRQGQNAVCIVRRREPRFDLFPSHDREGSPLAAGFQ